MRRKPSALALPAGLAQAVQHVLVVFGSVPWWPATGVEFERSRRNFERLLQRGPRFFRSTQLTQCRREPPITVRNIRIPGNDAPLCLDRPGVVTFVII